MSIVDSCVKFVSAYFAAGSSQASKAFTREAFVYVQCTHTVS